MKRLLGTIIFMVFVLSIILSSDINLVKASSDINSSLALGSWQFSGNDFFYDGKKVSVQGYESGVDLAATSAPGWQTLMTNSLTINHAAKICHPFNGGRYGWIGEIRQLVNGSWIKQATSSGWDNGPEGDYLVCAQAPIAGTYALFGYFDKPVQTEPDSPSISECDFDILAIYMVADSSNLNGEYGILALLYSVLPIDTPLAYSLISPNEYVISGLSGVGKVAFPFSDNDGVEFGSVARLLEQFEPESKYIIISDGQHPTLSARFEIPSLNCYKIVNNIGYFGN